MINEINSQKKSVNQSKPIHNLFKYLYQFNYRVN